MSESPTDQLTNTSKHSAMAASANASHEYGVSSLRTGLALLGANDAGAEI